MDLLVDILYYCILFFGACGTVELIGRLVIGNKPNKIDKIKALRAKTGLSLQECKRMIDAETGEEHSLH